MTPHLGRRTFLQMMAAAIAVRSNVVAAAQADAVTIGWPNDIPSWDPNQRFTPDAQPVFKMVFDQPLDQNPRLELVPNLVKSWENIEVHSPTRATMRFNAVAPTARSGWRFWAASSSPRSTWRRWASRRFA